MTTIVIVGIYQFYFWTQDHMVKMPRRFDHKIDTFFKFKPIWVWIYSGLYYPVIVLIIITIDDMHHYNLSVMSYVFLLLIQMVFFRYYPIETPPEWRDFGDRNDLTIRFIKFVQKYDKTTNCFPSMHVSVATLTTFHLSTNIPEIGIYVWVFPVLISLSALWTKQHYFIDLIPGVFLGWVAWEVYLWFKVV